jgi:indole-3-glycerol phosphate synthase/phosphoribosylanthranilate isomerase
MNALSKVGTGSVYSDSQLKDALESLYRISGEGGFCDHIFGWNDWSQHELSMLQKITATVHLDYNGVVSPTIQELEESANEFIQLHGSILSLHAVISSTMPRMALAAEYKRSSPSKGRIASEEHGNAGQQAVKYTLGGADIISCLTEPRWFQGTLADLTEIRLQTQQMSPQRRPAVLRKDFVVSQYMIAEAAAAGADTVLLIVAVLPVPLLRELMAYCRKVRMVPLVEIHTDAELDIALSVGATVIGINNRNLHTFQLDLSTSERIAERLSALGRTFRPEVESPDEDKILLCALSGMSTCHDVQRYRTAGISMCLIGESLMRSSDPAAAIASLCLDPVDFEKLNSSAATDQSISATAMVSAAYTAGTQWIKVCGITNEEDALVACQAGANLIGIIFVAKSKRRVSSLEVAKGIVESVRRFGERSGVLECSGLPKESSLSPIQHIVTSTSALVQSAKHRPLVVGVFQNQEMDFIRSTVEVCGLDMIQLHGNEGMAAANRSNFGGIPVIRVMDIATDPTTGLAADNAMESILHFLTNDPSIILLDTSIKNAANGGGTGISFDWTIAGRIQDAGVPVMVAGGLTPENVSDCIAQVRPFGVDVSSGVEMEPGRKDHAKVRAFVQSAKAMSVESNKGF